MQGQHADGAGAVDDLHALMRPQGRFPDRLGHGQQATGIKPHGDLDALGLRGGVADVMTEDAAADEAGDCAKGVRDRGPAKLGTGQAADGCAGRAAGVAGLDGDRAQGEDAAERNVLGVQSDRGGGGADVGGAAGQAGHQSEGQKEKRSFHLIAP